MTSITIGQAKESAAQTLAKAVLFLREALVREMHGQQIGESSLRCFENIPFLVIDFDLVAIPAEPNPFTGCLFIGRRIPVRSFFSGARPKRQL
jgi:hypothetical protein